jgi:hypothetical protein
VSIRERVRGKEAAILIIPMEYQRITDTADSPFSDALQSGGGNSPTVIKDG